MLFLSALEQILLSVGTVRQLIYIELLIALKIF